MCVPLLKRFAYISDGGLFVLGVKDLIRVVGVISAVAIRHQPITRLGGRPFAAVSSF